MGMHSTPATPGVNMPNNFPGQLGLFGAGQFQVFYTSGAFKVPAGVSRIRVRVVGGGGAGFGSIGGQAAPANGGTTSFAGLISASGGNGGLQSSGTATGGTGTGGDFQAPGGSASSGGGAAAGSQLGRGGNSLSRAGAGVGGGDTAPSTQAGSERFGGSPFGIPLALFSIGAPNALGETKATNTNRQLNPAGFFYRFPFECFFGAGGETANSSGAYAECGGVGAGASAGPNGPQTGPASAGGVGGGGSQAGTSNPLSGVGGIGAGGPGMSTFNQGGGAGAGYAHGVFDVTEGATLMATVAAAVGNGGPGLCVVEW